MSQKRFVSWNGKYNTTDDKDSFGMTIQDGNTPSNILQVTLYPTSSPNIQSYRFILEKSATSVTSVAAQTLIPDLTLSSSLYYQYTSDLTIVALNDINEIGTFRITGAFLNGALGGSSYSSQLLTHSAGMRNLVSESDISLSVLNSQIVLTITPRNNVTLLNAIADISITSASLAT
jgi:hypothetical protein